MLIGDSDSLPKPFNFGAAFAETALLAARPAFELQFFRTQEAILDNLQKEIENIDDSVDTSGATALLNVQISRLQNDVAQVNEFKSRTDAKATRIGETLTSLAELLPLATPGTVAAFDTKLAETISLMETTETPIFERFGVPDGLRAAKTDGLAQLNALVHNNFASQADIDNATAIINAIQADYLASQSIATSNTNIAFTLQTSATRTINELSRQISVIETEALDEATDKVTKKQEEFSQVLSMLSLAFEASQNFSRFIADSVTKPQEIAPGSVLNLFR